MGIKFKISLATIITLTTAVGLSLGLMTSRAGFNSEAQSLQLADSLYRSQNFAGAFEIYRRLSTDGLLQSDSAARFKIAYAAYKAGQYDSSAKFFGELYLTRQFLPKFSGFFYIKSLQNLDPALAGKEARDFVIRYKNHALADSLLPFLADHLYAGRDYAAARYYYQLAEKNKAHFLARAAMCLYHTGQQPAALDEFHQIIIRYPGQEETLQLTDWLREAHPEFYQQEFFNVIEVCYKNGLYDEARTALKALLATEKDAARQEKARLCLIEADYAEGRLQPALEGIRNVLLHLRDGSVEPYLRLYLARIFNRMNQKDKAIAAYLDFANRFPRRRQAVESVWKSAWLYEELNKPQQAMDLYRQIIRLWPASSYAREAQFREGFTLYRARQYERAAKAFAAIRLRNASDSHAHRAAYWLALCREAQGDSVSAAYLRRELARDLWDDYYTMKSYLMLNSHPDSAAHLARQFRGAPDPLRVVQPGYAPLVRQMAEAFQVGELLGNEFSLIALSDVRLNARSLGDWVALAEMYKKLRAYGLAYRTYDHIDRKFFRSLAYSQKPFIVKERFPFYYDNYIEQFGQRYGVEKEFILALMKQESVYQTDAHSSADAHGLMQLIPATAREMAAIAGVSLTDMRRLYEAELNIQLGALYIRQLQRHLGDRKDFILAAYNAGPHRVERWREVAGSDEMDVFIENIQFMETRDYVRKVMKNYWAYTLLSRNFAVTDSALFQTGRAQ